MPSWTGQLLVASPVLADGAFRRTVVLLVDHDGDGALGVVLNRPLPRPLGDLAPLLVGEAAAPRVVFSGGPVAPEVVVALSRPVGSGLCAWTAVDLAAPPDLPPPVRVFTGYAGWAPGQLEHEVDQGAWWLLDVRQDDLFGSHPDVLWRSVLRRAPVPLAYASTLPDAPGSN